MNFDDLKKRFGGYGISLALLIVLAVVVFRCALGPDNAFSASDANIGLIAGGRPDMAELFAPGYGGYILGSARAPRFSPYSFLHAALPPYLFNDLFAPLTLVASSFLLLVFLRLRKRSWGASFFGAVAAFWLGSATLASAGHYGKLGAACFFSGGLVLVEKSVLSKGWRRLCWSILCGTSVGFMLLSQQDIGLLFGVVLAPYALFRLVQTSGKNLLEWFLTLVPIALVGLVLSAGTALTSYKANVVQASSVNQSTEGTWDFITQWSQPPQEGPDLLAPGFMGWKTGEPTAPYCGITGQSPEWAETGKGFRNFRLDSVYLGLVPFLLALAALFSIGSRKDGSKERVTLFFWWIMAILLLLLAFGKFTPLYKLVINLPLFGSIRAPIKFLHNLSIVLGILSAYGIDAILDSAKIRKTTWISAAVLGGCFLLCGIVLMLGTTGIEGALASWGDSAPLIVKRMMLSSFYAAVFAGLFALLVSKGAGGSAPLFCGLVCLFPVIDSLYLTRNYFQAEDLSTMKRGNVVINYLKENNGRNRVFTFERGGVYNRWIGVEFPLHGIKGFWFWQAPRLSQEYKNYLESGNQNLVALLQSTSVKYALAPIGAVNQLPKDIFTPVMFYRFGMDGQKNLIVQSMARPEHAQDQVILELKKTLPRLSLFHGWKQVAPAKMNQELFSRTHDLMEQVIVDADLPASSGSGFREPASVDWKSSSVTVEVENGQDAVLLFTQRFQPQWKAYVDGVEQPVFRCNGLSMGVHLPAGRHKVVFKVRDKRGATTLQLLGLSVSLLAVVALISGGLKRKQDSIGEV